MKSVLAFPAVFLLLAASVSAVEPSFAPSDLSEGDVLLFAAQVDEPGWGPYRTLFRADLSEGDRMGPLTYFPERIRYYPDSRELEIQNRYGLYRAELDGSPVFRELGFHPSFADGDEIPVGRILPLAVSPNGRWVAMQEPTGPVRGRLVLHDTVAGTEVVLSENQVLEYRESPVLWSPDSRYALYQRDGNIYYASVRHVEESRLPDESYREFSAGTLSSVRWTGPDSMFFIDGSLVNLIRPSEFFTGSFYADPLPAGTPAGRLPIAFDPHFDRFWPSPDGKSIIVLTGERNLFLFPLEKEAGTEAAALPFLLLPRDTTVRQLWWKASGEVLLLAGGSRRGDVPSTLFRLNPRDAGEPGFSPMDLKNVRRFVPSPDRRTLAILDDGGVSLVRPDTFELILRIAHDDPRDAFWLDAEQIVIAGSHRVEQVGPTGNPNLIALSSADRAGFSRSGKIVAVTDSRTYRLDESGRHWTETVGRDAETPRTPLLESRTHRVYTEPSSSRYANLIHVRTIDGFGNRILFPGPEGHPVRRVDDSVLASNWDSRVFDHGPRTQNRDIALVFNAIDGDDGLGEIVNLLADYGIRATFFVGGDFIRQHPDAAASLARTPHEIGSLFYTHMDMTDFRYRIDDEFVIRGLGRNEDEFFRATGREISTLWHAPWYVVSPAILDATARMNYLYVGRDVDPQDWVSLDGNGGSTQIYLKSADLVERVLTETAPGSIIPVRVGKPGQRDDYFFRKLDLLINGLLKGGYDIVTVGELKEKSR